MNLQLPIISAEQRLAEKRGVKGVLVGKAGIGKTSQLWTLPEKTTLFFDLEAGDLAIEGWSGDTIRPRTWQECRDFAVFIDSITVAGRLCLQWCKGQPQAYSEKTGKPDNRGAYGLLGQELIGWLTHLQHTRHKNVWFVGILDEKLDDFNRKVFSLQIDGSKASLELPGIVDEVITLAEIQPAEGPSYRAFICHTLNDKGYPAKDRSGRLDPIEPPHLGQLMAKIQGPVPPSAERLNFTGLAANPQSPSEN